MTYPWYLKFWVWWVGVTLVYILFQFAAIPLHITGLIGLFVPYGFWNGIALFASLEAFNVLPILTLVLFVVVLFYTDKVAQLLHIQNPLLKILFNLVILLAITFVVDFSIYKSWESLHFMLNGDNVNM